MVLPPAGARSSEQLKDHFFRLADSAGLPILLQGSPEVTGVDLTTEALVSLAEAHPLRSLKVEIPGAGGKVSAAVAAGIAVVAGWCGLQYLEQLRRGASGCVPGCDLGPAFLAIHGLIEESKLAEADLSTAGSCPARLRGPVAGAAAGCQAPAQTAGDLQQ